MYIAPRVRPAGDPVDRARATAVGELFAPRAVASLSKMRRARLSRSLSPLFVDFRRSVQMNDRDAPAYT